jgi:hypothetical protein
MFTLTKKEAADISAFAELSANSRFMYPACWLSAFPAALFQPGGSRG